MRAKPFVPHTTDSRHGFAVVLVSTENAPGPDPKAHPRSDFRNLRNLFLKIWNHAILSVRPPMTRIRRGHALPEIPPPHVEPAAGEPRRRTREGGCRRSPRPRDRAARPRSDVARPRAVSGCSPSRARCSGPSVGLAAPAGRERNFSSLQTLENKRNRVGISPNPPHVRRTPMQRRRPFRRTGRSRDAASILGVVRGKSAGRRMGRRNFPIRKSLKRLETAKESRGRRRLSRGRSGERRV